MHEKTRFLCFCVFWLHNVRHRESIPVNHICLFYSGIHSQQQEGDRHLQSALRRKVLRRRHKMAHWSEHFPRRSSQSGAPTCFLHETQNWSGKMRKCRKVAKSLCFIFQHLDQALEIFGFRFHQHAVSEFFCWVCPVDLCAVVIKYPQVQCWRCCQGQFRHGFFFTFRFARRSVTLDLWTASFAIRWRIQSSRTRNQYVCWIFLPDEEKCCLFCLFVWTTISLNSVLLFHFCG